MTPPQRLLILLMVAGIPSAAPSSPHSSSPTLCLSAGSLTYQILPNAPAADLRVKITGQTADPDLRMQLVDSVESADFAVVDDVDAAPAAACSAGPLKTVRTVSDGDPADITVSLSRDDPDAALKLYVHSLRFGQRDAAALFAAMRHYEPREPHRAALEDASKQHSW